MIVKVKLSVNALHDNRDGDMIALALVMDLPDGPEVGDGGVLVRIGRNTENGGPVSQWGAPLQVQ